MAPCLLWKPDMNRHHVAPAILALAVAAAAGAQAPSLHTETPCGVFAQHGSQSAESSFPAGMQVGLYEALDEGTLLNPVGGIIAMDQGERVLISTTVSAFGTSSAGPTIAATSAGTGAPSPHSWVWSLPGPRVGSIEIDASAFKSPSATNSIAIDVGTDGSQEFVATGAFGSTASLPVNQQSGLTVRITIDASVSATPSPAPLSHYVSQSVSIAFRAVGGLEPASFGPIGWWFGPCGIRLFCTDFPSATHHQPTFIAEGAPPGVQSWLLFGVQALQPPVVIPNSPGCELELVPIAILPGTVDALGGATWSIAVPPPSIPIGLMAQMACLDASGTQVLTSSGGQLGF